MPVPRPEARALGERYLLALADATRAVLPGDRLGRDTGASLEFQDRRAYVPGDDVRHLDWRAYGRTDQLLVRQYREEVLPRLELYLDASRSLALTARKEGLALDVAALLAIAAEASGYELALFRVAERCERLPLALFLANGIECDGRASLIETLRQGWAHARRRSLRVLISDFLVPEAPGSLVSVLANGAGGLGLLQVLARDDLEPPRAAALSLVDAESDTRLDLVLDGGVRERYLGRLARLRADLERAARSQRAAFASAVDDVDLARFCRDELVPGRWLVPA